MSHHTQNPEMQDCIETCLDCYRSCQQTALTHCLEAGGKHVEPEHFRLMLDCAEICRTAAHLMLGNSPYHHAICGQCAEICKACAESCQSLEGMEDCAKICEQCARSCEQMAGQSAGGKSSGRSSHHANQ